MISIEDFKKIEIRAGKIISVETIEGSEKLLKLLVDFGPKPKDDRSVLIKDIRQVVSGIRKYFEDPQVLVNTVCAFVTNLESKKIMGLESQAMIMAVSGEKFFSLLELDCPLGSEVK